MARRSRIYSPTLVLVCCLNLPVLVLAEEKAIEIHMPAQSLGAAITQLATRANLLIGANASLLSNKLAPELSGRYTPEQALLHLLAGTGLVATEIAPGRYNIVPKPEANKPDVSIEGKPAGLTQLPEVVVTEHLNANSPYNTRYIRPNSLTATKTNTPIMETPFSIQVVPQQVLRDQQAIRLDTAVQNVSGVIQGGLNQGLSDGFLIRGFSSNTIYRNGVFMPDLLGGGTTKREMANVEQVDILKGPGSILFGRADPGGIINTVTKQPLATPYYSLQQQAGTYNFYRTTIDATGPLTKDGTLLYRMNLSYENAGSFRNFIDRESVFFAPVIRWNISPQTQVTAELEYQSFNEKPDPGIPNLGNRPAPVPRNLALHDPLNNTNRGDRKFFGVNWSHKFNDDWTLSHRLSAELFDFSVKSLFFGPASPNGSIDRFFNNAPNTTSNRYQSSVNLIGNVSTGILQHTLLFGYDYIHMDDKQAGNCCAAAPAFNIFSPSYLATAPLLDPNSNYRIGYTQSWHGAYFQDQIKLPYNIHVLAGFRYDNAVSRDTVLGLTTSAEDRFSPRGGLLWQAMPWLSLYGSYTENFGASNSLFSIDGSRLPPQTAQQWETGVKTEFWEGRLRSTLSYFELTKQGIGVPDPANPMRSRAIGEAETRGIEFDIAGEILRGWNVIATYTYMPFARITRDVGFSGLPGDIGNQGNRLFLAAKHYGSFWSTYDFQSNELRGLRFGAGVVGVGERQGDPGNNYQLPEYVIGNLMASYRVKVGPTRMSAQLNVNNVSGERYFVGTNGGNFITVGAPRTVMGSLRIEY
jgi:iron complex outermembrane receptor protein